MHNRWPSIWICAEHGLWTSLQAGMLSSNLALLSDICWCSKNCEEAAQKEGPVGRMSMCWCYLVLNTATVTTATAT